MRAFFIFAGVGIINLTYLPEMSIFGHSVKINVILTLFGLFLLYAGVKSWIEANGDDDDNEKDFNNSAGAKLVRKLYKRIV